MSINPRDLVFRPNKHDTLEADAVWDQLGLGASYEVSPLIGSDSDEPYAWQATQYATNKNANGSDVDPERDEYATKDEAIAACQAHNRERVISIIEEMLA